MAKWRAGILIILTLVLVLTYIIGSLRFNIGLGSTTTLRPPIARNALGPGGSEVSAFMMPTARDLHTAAYDTESDRMIVFGGDANSNGIVSELTNQTWAYDLNANSWSEKSSPESPPARWFHAMAYDSESDRVILFGGDISDSLGGEVDDTWAYHFNADAWSKMSPSIRPSPRTSHGMAYDSESDRTILYGGITPEGLSNETWAYDFNMNTWTNMTATDTPSALDIDVIAYDQESDLVILFGGFGRVGTGHGFKDETWAYDFNANSWMNLTSGTRPEPRGGHGMAYDSESDRVILFGGRPRSSDTWVYDVNSRTWTEMFPDMSPSARNIHTLAYDIESDRVVLFAGFTDEGGRNNETWAYDYNTNTWTPMTRPTPPQNLVAFAGAGVVNLTWDPPISDGGSPVTSYRVYRGTASDSLSLLVEVLSVLGYRDENVMAGTPYYYRVAAVTAAGEGAPSPGEQATPSAPPPPVDTTAPTVTITDRSNPSLIIGGPVASWTVTLRGTASDDVAVSRVELTTDGVSWVTATGTVSWEGTVTIFEGLNQIRVRAIDTAGNVAEAVKFIDIHGPPLLTWLLIAGLIAGAAASGVMAAIYRKRRRKV